MTTTSIPSNVIQSIRIVRLSPLPWHSEPYRPNLHHVSNRLGPRIMIVSYKLFISCVFSWEVTFCGKLTITEKRRLHQYSSNLEHLPSPDLCVDYQDILLHLSTPRITFYIADATIWPPWTVPCIFWQSELTFLRRCAHRRRTDAFRQLHL